ncbi:MAG TPA: twin-arginine translocase subunit TatC [Acidiferrobacterales bacterium]|jgi:sec-independent protein translocase protein TatC
MARKTESAAPDTGAEGAPGSFVSHLLELRNRLLYAIVGVGIVFAALVPFANRVYEWLAQPLIAVLPAGTSMIATEVASPFLTPLKLTLLAAIVIAVPWVLYQIWAFVAPGLYKHERRLVWPLLASSTLLFYAGVAFAYFAVLPLVFGFLVGTVPHGVAMMTDIKAYLDFVFAMFLAFGVAFELPVALVLLARMGVVNPDALAKKRPYVVLWVFIVAAFLTPPDVISQTLLAIPMLILFEIGLFIARRVRPRDAGDGALTEADMDRELAAYERDNPTSGKK